MDESLIQKRDEEEDNIYYNFCLQEMIAFLQENEKALSDYISICEANDFLPEYTGYKIVTGIRQQLQLLVQKFENILGQNSRDIPSYGQKISSLQQIYRTAVSLRVPASRILSWCSTSYRQSTETAFFHTNMNADMGTEFNYDRSRSFRSMQLENHMHDILGYHKDDVAVLMTSSGMSAYSLIENYLVHDILKPGDMIYSPRPNYGEVQNIMFRNPMFVHVQHDNDSLKDVIEFIYRKKPKVVMLSSLYNLPGTPLLDVQQILKHVSLYPLDHDIHFVIDETLLVGAVNPFLLKSNKIHIYLFSSMIKYLQAGMDSGYAGVVAIPVAKFDEFRRLRGMLGTNLYDHAAWLYPLQTAEVFHKRMERLTRNARITAEMLKDHKGLNSLFHVEYPLLPDHPDFQLARTMPYCGSLVTLYLKEGPMYADFSNVQPLFKLIAKIIEDAKSSGLSVIQSESFGFSSFRINAYGWYPKRPPYIRLSCGDRSYFETKEIINTIIKVLVH